MTIVYFYSHFAKRAGTERVLIEKMNWLSNHGYNVVALTYEQGDHPFAYDLSINVKHVDLNVRFHKLFKLKPLIRIYNEWRMCRLLMNRYNGFMEEYWPDIVVTTTSSIYASRAIANCSYPCKRLMESHMDKRHTQYNDMTNKKTLLSYIYSLWNSRIVKRNIKHFDLLISLNQTDADGWAPLVKTKVITNVVHLNSDGRYADEDSKHVIFVGRYVEQKGLFDLLAIWKQVNRKHPEWHLDLYGEGEEYDQLVAEAESMQANIHIHQSSANIFDCYKESSIFVLTSKYEPFGLVIPEAMSCGLPAVSFEAEGPCRIITDGFDGFLVKNRSLDDYTSRVCQLIEDKGLRSQMGRNAIQSAQCYSAEHIMPQWVKLFESLV